MQSLVYSDGGDLVVGDEVIEIAGISNNFAASSPAVLALGD